MTTAIRLYLLFVALSLLAACGQKGPLYLPGNPSEIRSGVPQADGATAPEEATEDDEDPDERR